MFLNFDPVKYVKDVKWADEQPDSWNSIPLVNIAGLWGTICFDNIDKNFQDLLCNRLGPGSRLNYYTNSTNHDDVQAEFGTLLLNYCSQYCSTMLNVSRTQVAFRIVPPVLWDSNIVNLEMI